MKTNPVYVELFQMVFAQLVNVSIKHPLLAKQYVGSYMAIFNQLRRNEPSQPRPFSGQSVRGRIGIVDKFGAMLCRNADQRQRLCMGVAPSEISPDLFVLPRPLFSIATPHPPNHHRLLNTDDQANVLSHTDSPYG